MVRALFTLSACLIFATGCGRDAGSMDDPSEPEPAVGEPESPEPEGPQPEGPEPDLPPVAEAAQDGVFRGRGTILLQLRGRHVFADAPRVEVTIFDAADARVTSFEAPVSLARYDSPVAPGAGEVHAAYTLEEGEWLLQHWWPSDLSGVRAEATLFDGDVAVIALDEPMFAVPIVGGDFDAACDPAGFANRCPAESACFVAPRPVQGFCRPTTVDAWLLDDGVTLDVTIEDNLGPRLGLAVLIDGQIESVELESGWTQRFFAPAVVDDAEHVDVFFNAHRVRAPVRAPEERWLGDDCDSLEIANLCAAGRCGVDAICVDPQAPVIEQATYNMGRVWDGAHVIGQDVDGDVAAVELTFINGEARRVVNYGINAWRLPGQARPEWRLSHRVDDDGRFELLWDRDYGGSFQLPEAVEVVVIDREGMRSEPVIAASGRPEGRDGWIEEGTLCDRAQAGFWGSCEEGTVCGLRDGAAAYQCQRLQICAEPERYVDLGMDAPAGAAINREENRTRLSCNEGAYDSAEGRFVFTAPADAMYRFTARGERMAAIALRDHCDLADATRFCAGTQEMQGADEVTVSNWYAAGATVYVLVEQVGYGSGVEVIVEAM